MVLCQFAPAVRDTWETPAYVFDRLNEEFSFDLDAAALPETAKCARYYTPEDDALSQEWRGTVWCNPPYGRTLGKWIAHGCQQAQVWGGCVVFLVPVRSDTWWWHHIVMRHASEVRFIERRIVFVGGKREAPFPSCLIIFQDGWGSPRYTSMRFEHAR